jgi:hypothetical protein
MPAAASVMGSLASHVTFVLVIWLCLPTGQQNIWAPRLQNLTYGLCALVLDLVMSFEHQ